ncbi:hypothetical protein CN380_01755 [Bacillus sp. AFS017274]|nr:hypothetical protein CN380_01755 [Bacillus sp. AFS017274]
MPVFYKNILSENKSNWKMPRNHNMDFSIFFLSLLFFIYMCVEILKENNYIVIFNSIVDQKGAIINK